MINFNPALVFFVFKVLLTILAGLYFIFSLVVIRQASLMTESLSTEVDPAIRVFAIFYAVLSLGVLILFIRLL